MAEPIYFFSKNDPYFEFSNFAPFGIEHDGVYWRTVEHYFQAHKFSDPVQRERIRNAYSPKQAKDLGQSRAIVIRADWDAVKEDVMMTALRIKFSHPKLKEILLGTGRRPQVESSPHDHYWGCGADGGGKNRLGHLLMQLRKELLGYG